MAWYKFHFKCGPGHQSNEIRYEYLSDNETEEGVKDFLFELADSIIWMDNWICTPEQLEILPDDIKAEKIAEYEHTIKHAEYMLNLLKNG